MRMFSVVLFCPKAKLQGIYLCTTVNKNEKKINDVEEFQYKNLFKAAQCAFDIIASAFMHVIS